MTPESCHILQGFGAEFVKEYIQNTGFDGAFNVGEFWTDLRCARLLDLLPPLEVQSLAAQACTLVLPQQALTVDPAAQNLVQLKLCISPSRLHRWGDEGLEYDQNGPRQTLVDWIKGSDGVSTTFDFPTKGILQARSMWVFLGWRSALLSTVQWLT